MFLEEIFTEDVAINEVDQVHTVLAQYICSHEGTIELSLAKLSDIARGVETLPLQADLPQLRTHLTLIKTLLYMSIVLIIGPQAPESHTDV